MWRILLRIALISAALQLTQAAVAASTETANATSSINPVVEWNRTLLAIVRTPGAQPPTIHSTRNFAILHIAIYDAVNNIERDFEPYRVRLDRIARRGTAAIAADQAAHDVLVSLYPSFKASVDAELQQDLASFPNGKGKEEAIEVGQTIAARILAERSTDGSATVLPPFVPGNKPGDYQLTPPNFPAADFIQWSLVTPFALLRADQFRPASPPRLRSLRYTDAFNEVKSLGLITSTTRTPEQTQIGNFWNGNIQDFWNEIAQTAALQRNLDLANSARLFALLNISLADTAIAFFEAKYFYTLWRPVTAVRLADTDGNPFTSADPMWLPLPTKTAADPSYPGAHSAISAAGAQVLKFYFGDRFSFDVTSESLPGVTRHFARFSQAAEEAGLSRIYAGQHFRFDHVAGKLQGRRVADFVVWNLLLQ